jgi:hypothetical protein
MSDGKKHAMHSPSSSDIWLDCSLHYHFKKEAIEKGAIWDTSGEAARRGTLQHKVSELAMALILKGLDVETAVDRSIRKVKPKITDEERGNVISAMHQGLELFSPSMEVVIEHEVGLSHEEGGHGTIDLAGEDSEFLLVADHKFGQKPVSPNSPQLKIYGANLVKEAELDREMPVKLAVIQPKLHSEALVRVYTVGELDRFRHYVEGVVDGQVNGHDQRGAGSLKTCDWCPAKKYCYHRPTLVSSMLNDLTMESEVPKNVVERIVLNRSAMKKVIDECAATVVADPIGYPNWRRVQVGNGRAWSDLLEPAEIMAKLKKAGAKDYLRLTTPAAVKDLNKPLGKSKSKVLTLVDSLSTDEGHHIRLYAGAPKDAPSTEPPKRPKTSSRKAVKKASKKKTAPKKAAKKARRSK